MIKICFQGKQPAIPIGRYLTGLPGAEETRIMVILDLVHLIGTVIIMVSAFTFNHIHLKHKFDRILQMEGDSSKNLISLKSLITVVIGISIMITLARLNLYYGDPDMPFGMFGISVLYLSFLAKVSLKPDIQDYFVHYCMQKYLSSPFVNYCSPFSHYSIQMRQTGRVHPI